MCNTHQSWNIYYIVPFQFVLFSVNLLFVVVLVVILESILNPFVGWGREVEKCCCVLIQITSSKTRWCPGLPKRQRRLSMLVCCQMQRWLAHGKLLRSLGVSNCINLSGSCSLLSMMWAISLGRWRRRTPLTRASCISASIHLWQKRWSSLRTVCFVLF